jgi:hypothetical protein
MKHILPTYEEASCQAINLQKSELFYSRNIPDGVREVIVATLGVRQVVDTVKYLGLLSMT